MLKVSLKKSDGFTTIELLISMLLMSILMVMIGSIFVTFNQTSYAMNGYLKEQSSMNDTLNQFDAQLREAVVPNNSLSGYSPGTNVIMLQPCIISSAACPKGMNNTITFSIPTSTGGQKDIQWTFVQGSTAAKSQLIEQIGTISGNTFTATGNFYVVSNIQGAQFCYLDRAGDSMTSSQGCPGNAYTRAYASSAAIAACTVAVTLQMRLAAGPDQGPLSGEIGVGLKNQTVEDVLTNVTLPNPPGGNVSC